VPKINCFILLPLTLKKKEYCLTHSKQGKLVLEEVVIKGLLEKVMLES
jgi:hypothetical protein